MPAATGKWPKRSLDWSKPGSGLYTTGSVDKLQLEAVTEVGQSTFACSVVVVGVAAAAAAAGGNERSAAHLLAARLEGWTNCALVDRQ